MDSHHTLGGNTASPMLGLCGAFIFSFLERNNLEKTLALSPHPCALEQVSASVFPSY